MEIKLFKMLPSDYIYKDRLKSSWTGGSDCYAKF
jgi:hypothetical protein